MIRESIRMSSAIRNSVSLKANKKEYYDNEIPMDLFKKLNLVL